MAFVLGEEFQISPAASGGNGAPVIATLSDGRLVVAYQSSSTTGPDADDNGVSASLFTATGLSAGGEFPLNSRKADVQSEVSVAALKTGGFVATWVTQDQTADGSGSAIKAQVFDAAGARSGPEFRVNTTAGDWQVSPRVTGLAGGNFVVVWADNTNPGNDRGQIFTATGQAAGSEFVLNGRTQAGWYPDIAALPGGGFIASWSDPTAVLGGTPVAQRFSATGQRIGSEFLVSTATAGSQGVAAFSAFADGGFVAVWTSSLNGRQDIKGQLFDANGAKSGGEFLINVPDNTYNQFPDVAVLADGSFVAVWQRPAWHLDSRGFVVDDGYGIASQQFTRSGTPMGGQVLIDAGGGNRYVGPSVTATTAGGYAVTWTDDSNAPGQAGGGLKARIFGPNSAPVITSGDGATATVTVAENTTAVTTVSASDLDVNAKLRFSIVGGADAAFFRIDPVTGTLAFLSAPDFEASAYHPNRYDVTVQVSDGHDIDTQAIRIDVTDVDETLGTAGDDTLWGTLADDTIAGLAGNDLLIARSGHDTLEGGNGNDILDGTGGIATASYAHADAGVRVSLAISKPQSTGGAGKDTLLSIEHLIGSDFADRLTGDAGDNHIMGGGGADAIDGGAGSDTMEGGAGDDTYVVDSAGDVVIELEGEGTGDVVKAGVSYALPENVEKLVLTGLANLSGSGNALANSLTGNGGDNWLSGGEGKDALSGGAGNDTLIGGLRADRLAGGAGSDTFVFDVLTSSADKDTITDFTSGQDRIGISKAAFGAFAGDSLGTLSPRAFVAGTRALTPDQHIIYNSAKGALYYDDDGSGAHAPVLLAVLSTLPTLSAADFLLI